MYQLYCMKYSIGYVSVVKLNLYHVIGNALFLNLKNTTENADNDINLFEIKQ